MHFPGSGAAPAVEIDVLSVWGTSVSAGPIIVQRAVWGSMAPSTPAATPAGPDDLAAAMPAPTKAA